MTFPDIVPDLKARLPKLRRLLPNEPLAPLTWFRVRGPAQALFMPEDEAELAYFLAHPVGRARGGRQGGVSRQKAESRRCCKPPAFL
jgi:hypothetical protein